MKTPRIILSSIIALALGAGAASADCYADYKAKRDNPLRLHYGVIQLPEAACVTPEAAAAEIRQRIAKGSWTLLNVISIFPEEGLTERRESAGKFFLRF